MQQDPIVNVQTKPEVDPEVVSFGERNKHWFNETSPENSKMKAAAEAVDKFLAQASHIDGKQLNYKEHLTAIESEVKRLFPHRFEQAKGSSAPTAPMVGKSTTSSVGSKSSSNLVNQLTSQQREM